MFFKREGLRKSVIATHIPLSQNIWHIKIRIGKEADSIITENAKINWATKRLPTVKKKYHLGFGRVQILL